MTLKQQAFKGLIWTFIEQFGGQVINFVVNLILARTLFPADFGVLGVLFVFITLANVLVDGGMKTSLIRKNQSTDKDYSSVFYANFLISLVIYFLIYFSAPLVANFYKLPQCTLLLRVFALSIILQSLVFVQSAILTKNLNFKKQSLLKLPAIALSSIIGLALAFSGFGVWSLVYMYLSQTFFWVLFHWIYCDWKPKFAFFDKTLFKYHFSFGYKLSITEIINALIANIYQITIGKFYSVLSVGYYTQSLTLRQLPISNIYGPVSKLALPIFSELRNDANKLKNAFIQIVSVIILVLSPVLFFLAVFSEPILEILYSEKWKIAAPFLFHLAVAGAFNVICSFCLVVLNIVEGSKILLKIELISKGQIVVLVLIILLFQLPLKYLLYSISISSIISFFLVTFYSSKYIGINFFKLLLVQFQLFLVSFVCIGIANLLYRYLLYFTFTKLLSMSISLLVAIGLYIGMIFLFHKSVVKSLFNFVKKGMKA